jgi:hypothetical protein
LKHTLWAAFAAALIVLACGAPVAAADSIAYIKDGNVWLASGDGSRQFQVTSTGGYSDVSQADDGTMIALNGVRLHRLDRMGNVTADFKTPVSNNDPAGQKSFWGPYNPALSPDGTKVAYTYYWLSQTATPACFPPKCLVALNEGGTGYSWADRETDWKDPNGPGYHSGWQHVKWVDNDMTMMSNPTHLPNSDVILDRISDGGNGHGNMVLNWFSDTVGNPHTSGGDITRDKTKLAFQTGARDNTLTVYFVKHFPTAWKDGNALDSDLQRCYRYEKPEDQSYGEPTFSPDGNGLAWHEADGIHIAAVPAFAGECTLAGATDNPPLVLPGGSEPDWGPADVPAGRPVVTPDPPVQPTPPAKDETKPFTTTVKSATRSGGVKLSINVPGKGKITVVAKRGSKKVGSTSKAVSRAGTASVRLRVKTKGRLKVRITFKPAAGGKAIVKTMTVRVR